MPATSHPGPDVARLGDVDRERAAARLRDHVGAGRLDLADFEHRVGLLYAAGTRAELAAAFVDLPVAAPTTERAGARRSGRYRRLQLTAFWGPFVLASAVSLAVWCAVGHPGSFWPLWVIVPWGLTLVLGDRWWWGPRLRRAGRRHGCRARRRPAAHRGHVRGA